MRLFIATLSTETNTFCPMPTAVSGFRDYYLRYGTATEDPPNLMTEALHVWRARAEALGWEVIEGIAAIAEPAGLTTAAAYAELKGRLLSDLQTAGPVDAILLQLHGAMVAEGQDDCEGDILEACRALCPDAVIGVSLDLHCHLTDRILEAADLVVTFKEYPHDDATPRAEEVFQLTHRTLTGEIRPTMAMHDCRMIGLYLTKGGAMEDFVAQMTAAEDAPGLLSLSLAHGFPWADVPDVGTRMLVISDGDAALARETARTFATRLQDLRHDVTARFATLDEALHICTSATCGPVVLADMGDNPGAGAVGDSTVALRALLDRGQANWALGLIWDPGVVRMAVDAGEGATLTVRLGGKTGPLSGEPVDLTARVAKIGHDLGQHLGPGLEPMGTIVRLTLDSENDILVNDLRVQVYHPEAFGQLGIDLSKKRIVVVKSTFHFHSAFAPVASQIIQVATPGTASPDLAQITYTRRDACYWPKVDNPFHDDHRSVP